MNGEAPNAVLRWFGPHFAQLHPLLQALHRQGGSLRGEVSVLRGTGPAGWIGARLLHRLGQPPGLERVPFEVQIRHEADVLHWDRRFGEQAWL